MNLGLKVIFMKVIVKVVLDVNIIEDDDIDYDDELINESLMNSMINFTPASRSSVEGEEVASMPCGHGYYNGCIVKWLETSHLCPLC
ncbi:hypothetical protein Golax_007134 [Gossypium laxum]|uniref:RING-type domain-containing protein n=1 Tax=Gossypium laxum TaxID=34288 RepID=A0A7J9A631_9ROSI|nr:hypothetical protein [Gossypium laxum]